MDACLPRLSRWVVGLLILEAPRIRQTLLDRFRTPEGVLAAPMDRLREVPGDVAELVGAEAYMIEPQAQLRSHLGSHGEGFVCGCHCVVLQGNAAGGVGSAVALDFIPGCFAVLSAGHTVLEIRVGFLGRGVVVLVGFCDAGGQKNQGCNAEKCREFLHGARRMLS